LHDRSHDAFFFSAQIPFLKEHGVRITAVSAPEPDLEAFGRQAGVPIRGVPMTRRLAPAADLLSLFRLYRLFRAERPDIVHSHTPKAGLLGTLAASLAGIRGRVVSIHGLPQMTLAGPMKRLLDTTNRLACRHAHLVWCDSPSMRRHVIRERLCPPRKVFVLGQGSVSGIDAEGRFNPAAYGLDRQLEVRSRYGIPLDAPVIGFIGRVVREKGMGELARAWREIRQEFPRVHLLLVGIFEPTDPLMPEEEEILRQDPRVHLTGWRHDIPEHLAIMELLVNPSYREGFGVAHLEAAAMGKPVLASRIPGSIDSVVDGVTGTLIPPRDVQALIGALRRYLADPALRHRHGQAGRARALAHFQPAAVAAGLLAKYRQLLSSS
jgi:glycosyltransferase involved in cell wall biosynthesis